MFFHNEFISMQDPYTGGSFSAILQKLSNLSKVVCTLCNTDSILDAVLSKNPYKISLISLGFVTLVFGDNRM